MKEVFAKYWRVTFLLCGEESSHIFIAYTEEDARDHVRRLYPDCVIISVKLEKKRKR